MLVAPSAYDFVVIGAGVIGITVARALRRKYGARVIIIEKESGAGHHASGRNSGVLHAGVYYKPGTLKARLCVEGSRQMKEYCRTKGIPMNEHGKVIVARNEAELPDLKTLYQRAQQNGATVSLLDAQALEDIEPCAKSVSQALYVKDTAVVNPRQVMKSLNSDAVRDGIEFRFDCRWLEPASRKAAKTSKGTITYGHLVNCAGLFADRVAHAFGVGRDYRILPFRGQYYRLSANSRMRVLGNIYPVPDLRNPFLGVHFTRQPEGEVYVGPSALPLLGREQYAGLRGINRQDAGTMCRYLVRLFRRNQDHFRSIAWRELIKITRGGFFREAEGLGIGLQPKDLLRGKEAGIRAQLVNSQTGDLVNDFVVEDGPYSTHVLNAVSPAFTSSFAFAEHIAAALRLDN